jgi:ketosteroid isomerase-like protein
MSQENVEVVKRAFEAWARRDVEAALGYMDPAVELQSAIIGAAEGNTYRGHDGFRDWMAESDTTFEQFRVEPEQFRDVGDDVLMLAHLYARGRGSGVEVDSPLAWICTLRDGKIVRQHGYLNPDEALEAVGLRIRDPEAWRRV